MTIWVAFFCRARLRFNGSWMTCFHFAPPLMQYHWHHHFHTHLLLQNIQDQLLFYVSLRGGWVVWNRRLSKLSFHVLFLWYVTEGWGVVPSRLTNMQRLSSHGWNNLYWGMFGSQGRIIFQSIPFVSCTAKWKWALLKNTRERGSHDDQRQNGHESSPSPVWERWLGVGSSTELLPQPILKSKARRPTGAFGILLNHALISLCVMMRIVKVKITSKTALTH